MDKFPLYRSGKPGGELTAVREETHTCFVVRCRLPEDGIWCAWLVGEQGELRLGMLEPEGDYGVLRRRFSTRMTQPVGRFLRGEIRAAGSGAEKRWEPLTEVPFRNPWLREQLHGISSGLTRPGKKGLILAIPYTPQQRFPLVPMFCFAEVCQIHGRRHVVFCFDENEWPVFWSSHEEFYT